MPPLSWQEASRRSFGGGCGPASPWAAVLERHGCREAGRRSHGGLGRDGPQPTPKRRRDGLGNPAPNAREPGGMDAGERNRDLALARRYSADSTAPGAGGWGQGWMPRRVLRAPAPQGPKGPHKNTAGRARSEPRRGRRPRRPYRRHSIRGAGLPFRATLTVYARAVQARVEGP
jgi:hypothetical protein